MVEKLFRTSEFSFTCTACGICCHDKNIQLNPFEVVQMADYLNISSSAFLQQFVKTEEPFLLFSESGNCVFLNDTSCDVHPVRPLACRLYPLGQHLSGEGVEHFTCTPLPGQCTGTIGTDGTVADFLALQATETYMEASNTYLQLFYRLYKQVYQRLEEKKSPAAKQRSPLKSLLLSEWFDVDTLVTRYCEDKNKPLPTDLSTRIETHILALEETFSLQQEA